MTDGITDLVLERIDEGYVLLDEERTVVVANRAARSLLGTDGPVAGADAGELPDGVGAILSRDPIGGEGPEVVEVPGDGEPRFVEVDVSPVDGEGDGDRLVLLRDVSARVRRNRDRSILEASGDAVYALDSEGICTYTNRAHDELLGYDEGELIGSPVSRVLDEAVIERLEGVIRELLASDDPPRTVIEHELVTADGQRVPVENHIALLLGDDGEFQGTAGVVRDVTERKEREEQLERYETLLDIMPDTVVLTDTRGNIVDLHGFDGWSGYDRDELVGEHISITTPRESIDRAEELIGELVEDDGREKVTYEMDVLTKGGECVPHENNMALLPPDEDGLVPGSMSVLRDISDRKERERAMRTLHDATREMVTADSKQAVATVTHEAAADVLGLTQTGVHFYDEGGEALVPVGWTNSLEEALGEPPALGPGSLAWTVFEDGEAVRVDDFREQEGVYNPDTPFRSEMIVPLGEHGVALFASTETATFDADDQRFAEVLCSNATAAMDRIGREEDLKERERELARQNERLEEFAGVVSHDLRNPLNVAHARVRMAIESADTGSLEKADDALERMNELIDDLLTLAREGEAIGELEPVDLADVVDEAWESVEAPDASIVVDVDRAVEADRARLAELFGNLFRNSIEHAGEGTTIHVGAGSDGGFYVEDDGPGIPPGEREAVFEHGVTGSDDGTGFGLAIVQDIAEAHDWSVRAAEGSTGGARFEFVPDGSAGDDDAASR